MKNKKYIAIISALLMILMALTACQDGKVPETPADAPVTVEAKFDNFIKTVAKENNPLNKVALISDAYGEMCDWEYDLGLAILYKESKDKLNNLTETYTIYSVADGAVLRQIMNTYPDEYGGTDDFGNTTYPEKSISDIYFDWTYAYNDVYYVVVEWETHTPIDEEIIEDEDLDTSYTVDTYYDFYDITGKFIATSSVVDEGDYMDGNESISLISFGKTVGVFDKDGKLVRTYNGDTEASPVIYDYSNDKYDYNAVPFGIVDEDSQWSRMALMIYDKEGNLVREYYNGDYATMVNYSILANSNVLIQHVVVLGDSVEADVYMNGMALNVDSFILDVETGAVTELPDFGYMLDDNIRYAGNFEDYYTVEGLVATENVRNVASATDLKSLESVTIFFDNFGNVNFVSDFVINQEMGPYDSIVRVIDTDHILVYVSSGVTDRAMLAADGSLIAYIPDDAVVLDNYIICEDVIYDLGMNRVGSIDTNMWFNEEKDVLKSAYLFGDCIVFEYIDVETIYEDGDSYDKGTNMVCVFDIKHQNYYKYENTTVHDKSDKEGMGGYVILRKSNGYDYNFIVINGTGDSVLTTPKCYYLYHYEFDDVLIVETADSVYLITEAATNSEGGYDK